jgi:ribosomal protein L10
MPSLINNLIVRELDSEFASAEGMVFVSLSGLSVSETEGLRDSLAEHGLRLRMVRNRLAKLAMTKHGFEAPEGLLVGNIGCCWGGPEDAINAAKVLHKSPARKAGKVALRGSLFEGNLLSEQETVALASLPGRDELRSMLLSALSGPARGLVGILDAPPSALARVLQAHVDAGGDAA